MIGYKGMKCGEANQAMDKTKILLRLEATINSSTNSANSTNASSKSSSSKKCKLKEDNICLSDFSCERTDITELKLTDE